LIFELFIILRTNILIKDNKIIQNNGIIKVKHQFLNYGQMSDMKV